MFRLGLLIAFVSAFLFLMTAWGLYVLLQTVNRDLALLFLLLNAVGVAIQCASLLQLISAIQAPEVAATAQLAANVYRSGFAAAQLFYGTWLFPLGYLVIKSKFLPRLLGILLILDGFAEMIWFTQALLLPAYPAIKVPGLVVSLLAEVGLALWLLIKGVSSRASRLRRRLPPFRRSQETPDPTFRPASGSRGWVSDDSITRELENSHPTDHRGRVDLLVGHLRDIAHPRCGGVQGGALDRVSPDAL